MLPPGKNCGETTKLSVDMAMRPLAGSAATPASLPSSSSGEPKASKRLRRRCVSSSARRSRGPARQCYRRHYGTYRKLQSWEVSARGGVRAELGNGSTPRSCPRSSPCTVRQDARACRCGKERAAARRNGPAQHVTAAASARLDRRLNGHVKANAGIKARELGADGESRSRNRPQSAPCGIARLKYLLDQLARHGIAVGIDAAAVGVVDRGLPSTTIWTSMQIPCKMSTGSNPLPRTES